MGYTKFSGPGSSENAVLIVSWRDPAKESHQSVALRSGAIINNLLAKRRHVHGKPTAEATMSTCSASSIRVSNSGLTADLTLL